MSKAVFEYAESRGYGELGNYNRQLISNSNKIDNYYFPPEKEEVVAAAESHARPKKTYPPGSSYTGEWTSDRMWQGKGRYVFPHGVIYEGEFADNQFHGKGSLRYPMEQVLKGEWSHGKLISWQYVTKDGLEYHDPWGYCIFPKRTYNTTTRAGAFKPPGQERVTNITPPRVIPPGCFDVGEGFYNPKLSCIVSATEKNKILRIPTAEEAAWIKRQCRSAEEGPIGYRPALYEYWSPGTAESVERILDDFENQKWNNFTGEQDE